MANEFKIRKGLIVEGATSGTVVDVQGSLGQLFSVTDNLTGEIFAVADISGVPIMTVNSSGVSYFAGNVGIGVASPGFATIDGYAQRGLEIKGAKESGTGPVIRLQETGSGKGAFEIRSTRNASASGNYLAFGEAADTFMVIRSDDDDGGVVKRGNVGIGMTEPERKLVLDGAFGTPALEIKKNTDRIVYLGTGSSAAADDNTILHLMHQNVVKIQLNTVGDSYLNGGDVGIGVTSPGAKLDVAGSIHTSGSINLTSAGLNTISASNPNAGYLRFMVDQQGVALTLNADATATFGSTVTATNFILSSDERLKENIKTLEPKVISAKWKSFNLKTDDNYRVGVIAQELEIKHPEFVETNEEGFKSVKYIDLLIAKIAELEARLEKAGI